VVAGLAAPDGPLTPVEEVPAPFWAWLAADPPAPAPGDGADPATGTMEAFGLADLLFADREGCDVPTSSDATIATTATPPAAPAARARR
jgi:hypothetical protein